MLAGSLAAKSCRNRRPASAIRAPASGSVATGTESIAPRLHFHFVDLDERLDIRVVGDVAHDAVGVRRERALEIIDRVEEEVAHGHERRLRSGLRAAEAQVDVHASARSAELLRSEEHTSEL